MGVPAAPRDLARRLDAAGAPPTVAVAEVMALKCGAAVAAFVAALPVGRAAARPARAGGDPRRARPAPSSRPTRGWRAARGAGASRWRPSCPRSSTSCTSRSAPDCRRCARWARWGAGAAVRWRPSCAPPRRARRSGFPRAQALERLARRCPLDGVAALVAAIGRSERHGAPLAPALHALAADARAQRAQRVRERAARAAPKIQLVVALLLVPAVMLLVGACLSAAVLAG